MSSVKRHSKKLLCFVISLSSETRNPRLLNNLVEQGICARVVKAVDGRGWGLEEIERYTDLSLFVRGVGRLPTGPEVGCALSHIRCSQIAASEDADMLLVLEDDVELRGNLSEVIDFVDYTNFQDPTVVSLYSGSRSVLKRKIFPNGEHVTFHLGQYFTPPMHAAGYILNRQALAQYSSTHLVEGVADWPPSLFAADFWGVFPSPLSHSSLNSQIEDARSRVRPTSGDCTPVTLLRNFIAPFSPSRFSSLSHKLGGSRAYARVVVTPHILRYFGILSMLWKRFFRPKRGPM